MPGKQLGDHFRIECRATTREAATSPGTLAREAMNGPGSLARETATGTGARLENTEGARSAAARPPWDLDSSGRP